MPRRSDVSRSLFRSRVRTSVLVTIASVREAYPGEIVRMCGIDHERLRWVMYGERPHYKPELALVALGLVCEISTATGRAFAITHEGAQAVRSWVRRARRG